MAASYEAFPWDYCRALYSYPGSYSLRFVKGQSPVDSEFLLFNALNDAKVIMQEYLDWEQRGIISGYECSEPPMISTDSMFLKGLMLRLSSNEGKSRSSVSSLTPTSTFEILAQAFLLSFEQYCLQSLLVSFLYAINPDEEDSTLEQRVASLTPARLSPLLSLAYSQLESIFHTVTEEFNVAIEKPKRGNNKFAGGSLWTVAPPPPSLQAQQGRGRKRGRPPRAPAPPVPPAVDMLASLPSLHSFQAPIPPVSLPLPPFIFSTGEVTGSNASVADGVGTGARRAEELGGQLVRHYFKNYLATSLTPQNSVGSNNLLNPTAQPTHLRDDGGNPSLSISNLSLAPTLLSSSQPPSTPFYPLLFRGLAAEEKRKGARGVGTRAVGQTKSKASSKASAGEAGRSLPLPFAGGLDMGSSGGDNGKPKPGVGVGAAASAAANPRSDRVISRRQKKSNKRFKLSWGAADGKGGEVSTLSCSFKGMDVLSSHRYRVQLNTFQREKRKFSKNTPILQDAFWIFELCLLLSDSPRHLMALQQMGNYSTFCTLPSPLPFPHTPFEYYLCLGIAIVQLCGFGGPNGWGGGVGGGGTGGPIKVSSFSDVHTAQLISFFDNLTTFPAMSAGMSTGDMVVFKDASTQGSGDGAIADAAAEESMTGIGSGGLGVGIGVAIGFGAGLNAIGKNDRQVVPTTVEEAQKMRGSVYEKVYNMYLTGRSLRDQNLTCLKVFQDLPDPYERLKNFQMDKEAPGKNNKMKPVYYAPGAEEGEAASVSGGGGEDVATAQGGEDAEAATADVSGSGVEPIWSMDGDDSTEDD